jgi:hypothetical protein
MRDEKSEKPKVPPPCPTVHHILLIVAPGDNGGEGVAHAVRPDGGASRVRVRARGRVGSTNDAGGHKFIPRAPMKPVSTST